MQLNVLIRVFLEAWFRIAMKAVSDKYHKLSIKLMPMVVKVIFSWEPSLRASNEFQRNVQQSYLLYFSIIVVLSA